MKNYPSVDVYMVLRRVSMVFRFVKSVVDEKDSEKGPVIRESPFGQTRTTVQGPRTFDSVNRNVVFTPNRRERGVSTTIKLLACRILNKTPSLFHFNSQG